MNKVYIVYNQGYSDYHDLIGVFSSLELAKLFIKHKLSKYPGLHHIEDFDIEEIFVDLEVFDQEE